MEQCRFVPAKAEEFVRRAVKTRPAAFKAPSASYDAVILDPPREGCASSVLEQVFGELGPARGIYISCNPEALARDLRSIVSRGYTIRSLQPVDMFPHTAHVETVAVLDRAQESPRR